jgi:hypothetical protein
MRSATGSMRPPAKRPTRGARRRGALHQRVLLFARSVAPAGSAGNDEGPRPAFPLVRAPSRIPTPTGSEPALPPWEGDRKVIERSWTSVKVQVRATTDDWPSLAVSGDFWTSVAPVRFHARISDRGHHLRGREGNVMVGAHGRARQRRPGLSPAAVVVLRLVVGCGQPISAAAVHGDMGPPTTPLRTPLRVSGSS